LAQKSAHVSVRRCVRRCSPCFYNLLILLVIPAGFEPATLCLEASRKSAKPFYCLAKCRTAGMRATAQKRGTMRGFVQRLTENARISSCASPDSPPAPTQLIRKQNGPAAFAERGAVKFQFACETRGFAHPGLSLKSPAVVSTAKTGDDDGPDHLGH
jgi:hypothetical protein